MVAQALDHPPRPAPALAHERPPCRRHLRERHRRRLEHAAPAVLQHPPRQHDVLADPVRPAARQPQRRRLVHAERALRDQRPLQQRLRPLHARDPQEVVPLLCARQQVLARVARQHRTRHRDRVRRRVGEACHRPAQRVRHQQRVRVDRRHQRRLHLTQRRIQRFRLAAVVDLQQANALVALRVFLHDLTRAVGRAIVRDHDLERARIVAAQRVVERLRDRLLLVVRRDQQRHRRELHVHPQPRRGVQHDRRQQLEVQVARDQRDPADHHDRQRQRQVPSQLRDPVPREPRREHHPQHPREERQQHARPQRDVQPFVLARRPVDIELRRARVQRRRPDLDQRRLAQMLELRQRRRAALRGPLRVPRRLLSILGARSRQRPRRRGDPQPRAFEHVRIGVRRRLFEAWESHVGRASSLKVAAHSRVSTRFRPL